MAELKPHGMLAEQSDGERREAMLESMLRILREELAIDGDERFAAYLEHMRNVARP